MVQRFGGLAQLGERLPCKQEVTGSIPVLSTKRSRFATKHFAFSGMRILQSVLRRSGGPKWTRTIDLTIISRVL